MKQVYEIGDRVYVKEGLLDTSDKPYKGLPSYGTVTRMDVLHPNTVYVVITDAGDEVQLGRDDNKEFLLPPTPVYGERILVWDDTNFVPRERIFVYMTPPNVDETYKIHTVQYGQELTEEESSVETIYYKYWKRIEPKKDVVELTLKVNGKVVPLSNLSVESFKNLRK